MAIRDEIAVENRKVSYLDYGEKVGRNKQLVRDYLARNEDGTRTSPNRALVEKYGISRSRIYQILDHYRKVD